jgi:hypothetical protein
MMWVTLLRYTSSFKCARNPLNMVSSIHTSIDRVCPTLCFFHQESWVSTLQVWGYGKIESDGTP